MKRRRRPVAALIALLATAACSADPPRPHIVLILADDLGWNGVGYHGSVIATPNLDRLAAAGAKLEAFYAQPSCTPSRAALLTGRYPIRYGLQTGSIRPRSSFGLPLEERTLAQALSAAGYATAMFGKWHLGHHQRAYLPTQRGFDRQYGHYNGWIDHFTHQRDGGLDWHRDDRALRESGYDTVLIGDEAVRLIEGHDFATPLFLYLAFGAPHIPLQALPEHLALYAGIADPAERAYAAMVHALDEQVGRVAAAIRARGVEEDTLLVFASDNGGPLKPAGINAPLRAGKYHLYEGGIRVVAFATWPGRIAPGTVVTEPLHMVDWFPTLLGLAGAPFDAKLPLDGRDAWPTIARGAPSPHEVLLLNAAGRTSASQRTSALRAGPWKLIVHRPPRRLRGAERVELFDLARDPGEQSDLAAAHPERVAALRAQLEPFEEQAVPFLREQSRTDDLAGLRAPGVWGE
jgi:arylsulfatase A-like enzyme